MNVGGPALHVVGLHAGLTEHPDFDPTLLVGALGAGEADMAYAADEAGVEYDHVPGLATKAGLWGDLKAVWWLYRRMRRDQPDIVHTHTAKAGALGRTAAALARVPVRIHTFHGHVLGGGYFSPRATAAYRFIERALARLTTRLIVLSPTQAEELSATLRVADPERFAVIPLGLDLAAFSEVDRSKVRGPTRETLGIPSDAWVVASIGRIVPIKNHSLLLRAFAAAVRRDPERHWILLVAGDGEAQYRAELGDLAKQLGVEGDVRWLGWRRDLPELLAAADVFALTSDDEGTPVAMIEALSAGTVVVARSVGGVADVADAAPHAIVVDTDEPVGFGRALKHAQALELDAGEVRAARSDVARRFARHRLVDDVATLYRDAVESVRA